MNDDHTRSIELNVPGSIARLSICIEPEAVRVNDHACARVMVSTQRAGFAAFATLEQLDSLAQLVASARIALMRPRGRVIDDALRGGMLDALAWLDRRCVRFYFTGPPKDAGRFSDTLLQHALALGWPGPAARQDASPVLVPLDEARARELRASTVLEGFRRRRRDAIEAQRRLIVDLGILAERGNVERLRAALLELAELTEAINDSFTNGEEAEAVAELAHAARQVAAHS